jgi:hypothetical protein
MIFFVHNNKTMNLKMYIKRNTFSGADLKSSPVLIVGFEILLKTARQYTLHETCRNGKVEKLNAHSKDFKSDSFLKI